MVNEASCSIAARTCCLQDFIGRGSHLDRCAHYEIWGFYDIWHVVDGLLELQHNIQHNALLLRWWLSGLTIIAWTLSTMCGWWCLLWWGRQPLTFWVSRRQGQIWRGNTVVGVKMLGVNGWCRLQRRWTLAADVVDMLLAVTMIRGEEEESTSMLSTGVRMSLSINVVGWLEDDVVPNREEAADVEVTVTAVVTALCMAAASATKLALGTSLVPPSSASSSASPSSSSTAGSAIPGWKAPPPQVVLLPKMIVILS